MSEAKNYLIALEGTGTYWFTVVITIICQIILSNKNEVRGELSHPAISRFMHTPLVSCGCCLRSHEANDKHQPLVLPSEKAVGY